MLTSKERAALRAQANGLDVLFHVGKGGVVRDQNVHLQVLRECCVFFADSGCGVLWMGYSPICGGDGNIEYLALLGKGETGTAPDLRALVREAFINLKRKE